MARAKKDRTSEVQTVFDNLKYCSIEELIKIQEKCDTLISQKADAEIAEVDKQIEELQQKKQAFVTMKVDKTKID